jgi:DNA-binding MarR family transcriptional regulator
MKLSRRIRHLVRANLASPRRSSSDGRTMSLGQTEKQLEQIRKSLVQAAARENRLLSDLALAQEEGRERDANRLRRELNDLARSADELQAALALIEARIEMERKSRGEAPSPPSEVPAQIEGAHAPRPALEEDSGEEEEADLAARKARLAAPEEKREATGDQSH